MAAAPLALPARGSANRASRVSGGKTTMRRRFATAAAMGAACMTMAWGGAAQALPFGPSGPKSVEFQADNPAAAAIHLTSMQLEGLKGVRRIVVPQFQVEYVMRSQGLTRKERNQVTVEYSVAGISDAALQAVTDKLYARFVEGLRSAGLEVVSDQDLRGTQAWSKLAAVAKPSATELKSESGVARMITAGAAPYYFYPGDTHLGVSAVGWGFTQAHMTEQALSKELDAAVMTVHLVVGIRETDKHSQAFALVRTASSFVGDPKLNIEAPSSALYIANAGRTGGVMKPTGRAGFAVKTDLLFQEDVLGPTLKDASGVSNTAGNALSSAMFAGNLLANMAGGGIGMKLYKSYKFESSPAEADYIAAVDRNLSGFQDALLAQLKAAIQ